MSESVIADFVGKFHGPSTPAGETVAGRIVCSRRRLVLAADSDKTLQIPLDAVVDIGVGTVPEDLTEFFDSTVTVVFERGDAHRLVAIEANNHDIRKFATVLFSAILTGTNVTVAHPARRAGRVTDEPFQGARVQLDRDAARFVGTERRVRIGLEDVTSFDREQREIRGRDRPVLVVSTVSDGDAVTTLISAGTTRKLSLLGRFLRIEYGDHAAEVRKLELPDDLTRALVVRYTAASNPAVSIGEVLGIDDERAAEIRTDLAEHGLLHSAQPGGRPTYLGRIVVENFFDDLAAGR